MERAWLEQVIDRLAEFDQGGPGVTRPAFSVTERQAREYVQSLMEEAGLSVRVDAFSNLIGRLEGTNKTAPAVVTGSHLDTVPEGGRYDGVVGVVGGLAAVKRLKERGALTHPLELVVFAAEESSRFGYSSLGSKAMIGQTNISVWTKAKDTDGTTLPAALAQLGLDMGQIKSVQRPKEDFKAFVELHIEQGPVLERAGRKIGIVEAIAAPTRLRIFINGNPAHSGTTPMDKRQDALVSAAMIILAVQEIALEESHHGTVATVGVLKVYPNVMNVIPGRVELGVDIRSTDQESLIETIQEIKDAISTIADGQDTPVAIEVVASEKPVRLAAPICNLIEAACGRLRLSSRRMVSGAGHDAMYLSQVTPTGMIFIPCRGGISHNPEEYASPDDIMNGVDVLTETLFELAR